MWILIFLDKENPERQSRDTGVREGGACNVHVHPIAMTIQTPCFSIFGNWMSFLIHTTWTLKEPLTWRSWWFLISNNNRILISFRIICNYLSACILLIAIVHVWDMLRCSPPNLNLLGAQTEFGFLIYGNFFWIKVYIGEQITQGELVVACKNNYTLLVKMSVQVCLLSACIIEMPFCKFHFKVPQQKVCLISITAICGTKKKRCMMLSGLARKKHREEGHQHRLHHPQFRQPAANSV